MKEYIIIGLEDCKLLIPVDQIEKWKTWVSKYYKGELEDYEFPSDYIRVKEGLRVFVDRGEKS